MRKKRKKRPAKTPVTLATLYPPSPQGAYHTEEPLDLPTEIREVLERFYPALEALDIGLARFTRTEPTHTTHFDLLSEYLNRILSHTLQDSPSCMITIHELEKNTRLRHTLPDPDVTCPCGRPKQPPSTDANKAPARPPDTAQIGLSLWRKPFPFQEGTRHAPTNGGLRLNPDKVHVIVSVAQSFKEPLFVIGLRTTLPAYILEALGLLFDTLYACAREYAPSTHKARFSAVAKLLEETLYILPEETSSLIRVVYTDNETTKSVTKRHRNRSTEEHWHTLTDDSPDEQQRNWAFNQCTQYSRHWEAWLYLPSNCAET
jgi:hypothetical protein